MREFAVKHKGFLVVLALETIMILIMSVVSFRKPVTYTFDCDNLSTVNEYVETDDSGIYHINERKNMKSEPQEIVKSSPFALRHGMYEITVEYESALKPGSGYRDYTGSVKLVSQKLKEGIRCNEILLYDTKTSVTDRIWVTSFNGVNDIEAGVFFNGVGSLEFTGITIRELPLWRIVCITGWILFFAITDFVYLYFFTEYSFKNRRTVIWLGLIIIFSSLPLFTNFLYWGHDMDFHTARIWSLAEGIKNGHWIVPIQTEMVNGYGYATPLFYCQLFLYIPALIYCLGAPLQLCYQIYAFLINAATCLICYYCMIGLFKKKQFALFGAFLYTMSSYRLADMYTRASVGEYTAMAFLPLIVYGFARVYMTESRRIKWRDYMPIVIGLTGIIRSHVLTCELTALCIGLFCLITVKETIKPARVCVLIKAALLTLALNAAFIIPMLHSMTMDLTVKANKVNQMQEHGTYLIQILGMFMTSTGGSVKGTLSEMPMSVGFALIIGLGIVVYCRAKQYEWEIGKDRMFGFGKLCTVLALISLVFSMHFMQWDSIQNISGIIVKILCMIQYPWRYYAFATVFCVFAAVAGIYVLSEHKGSVVVRSCCYVMLALTFLNAGLYFANFANEAKEITVYGEMPTEIGYGEYLPTGTNMKELVTREIITDDAVVTVSEYTYDKGNTSFVCKNMSEEEQTVRIPLLNYDNYHAYDTNCNEEIAIRNGYNNCIDVVIKPCYDGKIEVRYEIPTLWRIAYAVSAIATIAVIAAVYIEGRRVRSDKESQIGKRE